MNSGQENEGGGEGINSCCLLLPGKSILWGAQEGTEGG